MSSPIPSKKPSPFFKNCLTFDNLLRCSSLCSLIVSWLIATPVLSILPGASIIFWGSRVLCLYTIYDMGGRIRLNECIEKLKNLVQGLGDTAKKTEAHTSTLGRTAATLSTGVKGETGNLLLLTVRNQQLSTIKNLTNLTTAKERQACSDLASALIALKEGAQVKAETIRINSAFESRVADLITKANPSEASSRIERVRFSALNIFHLMWQTCFN